MRPLTLIIVIIFFCFCSCQTAITTNYYLPQNFEGFFTVIYSQANGVRADVIDGKRSFKIPNNGILLTKEEFVTDGKDFFLIASNRGYDTLRSFLSIKEEKETKIGKGFAGEYTNDVTEVAVNLRHFINPTYNKFDSNGKKIGECKFFYEIVTIGKANMLSDSIGKNFEKKIASLLQDTLCTP